MGRIRKVATSMAFEAVNIESQALGETRDCSVRAVALVTGASYVRAHAVLAQLGRKNRHGASTWMIEKATRILGKQTNSVNVKSIIARYPKGHCDVLQNVTSHHPARFPKAWADGHTYLAFTSGHVLAIVNGVCHDWSVNSARRVTRLVRVDAQCGLPTHPAEGTCVNCAIALAEVTTFNCTRFEPVGLAGKAR